MLKRLLYFSLFLLFYTNCKSQIPERFLSADRLISSWIDTGYYEGACLIVSDKHKVLFKKKYGNYDYDTKVYIASAGKWLAAATIAAVVEHSNLKWTDQVKKWLPEFRNDFKGEVTLAQLMSHTANYPDYQPSDKHRDDYSSLKKSVDQLLNLPLRAPLSQKQFYYGGLSMQVAGRMAELAMNKTWEELFQSFIAKPMNMMNTHFIPVDTIGGGHSPMIGGGAVSTLNDYAHFLNMLLHLGKFENKMILHKSSIEFIISDQVKGASISEKGSGGNYVQNVRRKNHTSIYGIGCWREILDQKGKATLVSSPSWAGAYPWIDYDKSVFGFFITHIKEGIMGKNGFNSFWRSPILADLIN